MEYYFTKEEYHNLHQKLWNWLSQNPTKEKFEWPEWEEEQYSGSDCFYKDVEINNDCFCCEYSCDHHDGDCYTCLVEWPNESITSMPCSYEKYGIDECGRPIVVLNLFKLWEWIGEENLGEPTIYMDYERILRMELAYEIANLPLRGK